jgi:hypothetical protein
MSVACGAEVCGRFLWGSDTSNKPFEWTGRHHLSAEHPKILACHSRAALDSAAARQIEEVRIVYQLRFSVSSL